MEDVSLCLGLKINLKKIRSFSFELGLDLSKPEDRFKWFLASILFTERISAKIVKKTFKRFEAEGLDTAGKILSAGWDDWFRS